MFNEKYDKILCFKYLHLIFYENIEKIWNSWFTPNIFVFFGSRKIKVSH